MARIAEQFLEPAADQDACPIDGRHRPYHGLFGAVLGNVCHAYPQGVLTVGFHPGPKDHDLCAFGIEGAHRTSIPRRPSPARDRDSYQLALTKLFDRDDRGQPITSVWRSYEGGVKFRWRAGQQRRSRARFMPGQPGDDHGSIDDQGPGSPGRHVSATALFLH
jgi:hypothetical protein